MRSRNTRRLAALLAGGVLLQFTSCAAALVPTIAAYAESLVVQGILSVLFPQQP